MEKSSLATIGGGCFWCLEAVFQEMQGVVKVVNGYSGGQVENPTYKEVCNGSTGHAEVVQIEYLEGTITFNDLLEVFFAIHNPTSLNSQGADHGTQYRSIILYHNEEQKAQAIAMIQQVNQTHIYGKSVVTEVVPLIKFYSAEDYHQNYFSLNSQQPYCQHVVRPKLNKFKELFERFRRKSS